MNPSQTESCENIAKWLMIATYDLCELSKARIALEIETHFNEAVEARLGKGESLERAWALTLQELGDPNLAAVSFRQRHLSEDEDKKLKKFIAVTLKPNTKSRIFLDILSFVCCAAALPVLRITLFHGHYRDVQTWCFGFLLLSGFSTICVLRVLTKQLPLKGVMSRVVLVHYLSQIISMSAFCAFAFFSAEPSGGAALFGCLIVLGPTAIVRILPWIRIWQKLRNNTTNWDLAHSGSNPTSAS